MKIKAVIVDWLPEACFDCEFEGSKRCILACELLDYTRYETRPDWCPLMLEGWISVEDRLPPIGEDILYLCWDARADEWYYHLAKDNSLDTEDFTDPFSEVRYWKKVTPLPDPQSGNKK